MFNYQKKMGLGRIVTLKQFMLGSLLIYWSCFFWIWTLYGTFIQLIISNQKTSSQKKNKSLWTLRCSENKLANLHQWGKIVDELLIPVNLGMIVTVQCDRSFCWHFHLDSLPANTAQLLARCAVCFGGRPWGHIFCILLTGTPCRKATS